MEDRPKKVHYFRSGWARPSGPKVWPQPEHKTLVFRKKVVRNVMAAVLTAFSSVFRTVCAGHEWSRR